MKKSEYTAQRMQYSYADILSEAAFKVVDRNLGKHKSCLPWVYTFFSTRQILSAAFQSVCLLFTWSENSKVWIDIDNARWIK